MRILALEISGATGSIALLERDRSIVEMELEEPAGAGRQRPASALAPALQSILREAKWEPRDIELIAVTEGPGSFTGLRAGITTAKVFAYATGAEVVAVNTLEVVAAQASVVSNRLTAVMDAQRQQLYAAWYAVSNNPESQTIRATQIVDIEAWLQQLVAGDYVTGTGLAKLVSRLPNDVQIVAEEQWSPRAATLGQLAFAKYESGLRCDFWKLVPQYFRKSAAEEKFEQGLLK